MVVLSLVYLAFTPTFGLAIEFPSPNSCSAALGRPAFLSPPPQSLDAQILEAYKFVFSQFGHVLSLKNLHRLLVSPFDLEEQGGVQFGQIKQAFEQLEKSAQVSRSVRQELELKNALRQIVSEAIRSREVIQQIHAEKILKTEFLSEPVSKIIANLGFEIDQIEVSQNGLGIVTAESTFHYIDFKNAADIKRIRQPHRLVKGHPLNPYFIFSESDSVRLYDSSQNSFESIIKKGRDSGGAISSIALSQDAQFAVAFIQVSGEIYSWERGVGQKGPFSPYSVPAMRFPSKPFILPDRRVIFSINGKVHFWDPKKPRSLSAGGFGDSSLWTLSAVGNRIISLTWSGSKNVHFSIKFGGPSKVLEIAGSEPQAIALSSKGDLLAMLRKKESDQISEITIWSVASSALLGRHSSSKESFTTIGFLADDSELVIGSDKGNVHLLNVESLIQRGVED